jgi:hypothetical protein
MAKSWFHPNPMNKKSFVRDCWTLCAMFAFLILTGCVPSLQPFYAERDLTFEPALVGDFQEADGSAVWSFSKAGEREYRLVIKDKANSSIFSAHFFKLGKDHYLDLYAAKEALDDCPREDFFKAALVPGHLLLKVPQLESSSLSLQVMDEDQIKEYLKKNKDAVPHALIESDRLVFTGSTEQMQAFVKKLEENAWGKLAEFKKTASASQ